MTEPESFVWYTANWPENVKRVVGKRFASYGFWATDVSKHLSGHEGDYNLSCVVCGERFEDTYGRFKILNDRHTAESAVDGIYHDLLYSRWVLPEEIKPVQISIRFGGVLKLGDIHYGRFRKLAMKQGILEGVKKLEFFCGDCIQNIDLSKLTVSSLKGLGEYLDFYCWGLSDLICDFSVNLKIKEFRKS